jgi:NAD(P)H-flavin reductase
MAVFEELTNGTKHLRPSVETARIEGYGRGLYDVGPYGKPYLLIDFGSGCSPRYQTAEQLIDDAVAFWRGFFNSYFNQDRNLAST